MESNKDNWDLAKEGFENYVSSAYELYKYEAIEKTSKFSSSIATSLTSYLILGVSFFFFLTGIAFLIAELTGFFYYGFLSVALLLLIVFFTVRLSKKSVKKQFLNFFIKKFFEK